MTLGRVMGWTAARLVAGGCGVAQAAWPDDQSIDLVVGFAPGGGTDLMARAMAPYVEKRLGGRAHIVVVNKPGAGEFMSALLGGHVDYAFMSVAEFLVSNDENSPLRPVVLFHDQPMPVLPGVPTAAQEGYPVLVSSERGIAGPLALPDDIAGRLEGAIRDTLADPVFIKSVRSDAPVLSFVPGRAWTQSLNALPATLEPFVGKMKD